MRWEGFFRGEKYENLAEIHGNEYVYNILKNYDGEAASKLHPNDTKRVIRAIEIYEISGTTKSTVNNQDGVQEPILKNPLIIGLNFDRKLLYDKINRRVDIMLNSGLIDEVKTLVAHGYDKNSQALKAIGYKEVISYIDGDITYDECVDKIKQHTRNYAKRQLTYFRRNNDIVWLDSYNYTSADLVNKILDLLHK